MKAGKDVPACSNCIEVEDYGLYSMRQWANEEFAHRFPRVAATDEDGSLGAEKMSYIDVRYSNVCNFRCRTCSPYSSTRWHSEGKAMGMIADQAPRVITPGDLDAQLEALLPDLDMVTFAGGEPLIMEEHYRVLDRLIERKLFHVKLHYITNFSVTSYKGRDILELWNRFERVRVHASLDGMGERGEYLRKGQVWARVEDSAKRLSAACPRVEFNVASVLNAMNALHLPDFHRDWVEKGLIGRDRLYVNVLFNPAEYSVRVLPPRLKARVAERYAAHADFLRSRGHERNALDYQGASAFMLAKDETSLLPAFRRRTLQLDELRSESFGATFPEFAELLRAS